MIEHAREYPPSGAGLYINCPGSVTVVPLYPNDSSAQSEKGDVAHEYLETALIFGTTPKTGDVDLDETLDNVLEWVRSRRREYGQSTQVYAELRLPIPITEQFGTADGELIADDIIEILDYKNGYVMVHVRDPKTGELNDQCMSYLLGAIQKFGARSRYRITIIQPNANHIDGVIRTADVTPQDVEDFRAKLRWAVSSREFFAGAWCKKYYCDHRGACASFNTWAIENPEDAWWTSEVNAMTDEQLAKSLDKIESVVGYRDELRKEAMRRILNMDRKITGYKMVKGKIDRQYIPGTEDQVKQTMLDYGASEEDMYSKKFVSPAGVEAFVKKLGAGAGMKRGEWKEIWTTQFAPHVREYSPSLTLEKATDGRPAHRRGGEFGAIPTTGPELVQTERKVMIV